MDLLRTIGQEYIKEVPAFNVGDTVKVHVKIREGEKERIHAVERVGTSTADPINTKETKIREEKIE